MLELLHHSESIFYYIVEWGTLILESFGVIVLMATGIFSMIKWLRRMPDVRMTLAQGILLGLSFKMGGEVLRTVITKEPEELFIVLAIIVLRAIVAALIYWEMGKEAKMQMLRQQQKQAAQQAPSSQPPEYV